MLLLAGGCSGTLPPLDGTDDFGSSATDGGAVDAMELLPFGGKCTMDSQCETGHCFIGGMMSWCTMPCTPQTAMTDCPMPPTSGVCNMKGYCKM
jgi:hypothetical protein